MISPTPTSVARNAQTPANQSPYDGNNSAEHFLNGNISDGIQRPSSSASLTVVNHEKLRTGAIMHSESAIGVTGERKRPNKGSADAPVAQQRKKSASTEESLNITALNHHPVNLKLHPVKKSRSNSNLAHTVPFALSNGDLSDTSDNEGTV